MNTPGIPSPHTGELVQMRAGVIYVNREPVLRFASSAQAGIFLLGLDYRASERGHLWTFWKPKPKAAA